MTLSFNDYAKKLETLGQNVPKIFKNVAKRGAIHFENTAKELTDIEKAVDTGAYRRNWNAEVIELNAGEYGIVCMNSMEYASFLEDGYEIHKAHFVPFEAGSGISKRTGKAWNTKGMQGSPKTQKLIASIKAKYPDAKGFIAKPRRFKGLKIGRRAMDNTEGWLLLEIRNEIEIAIVQQKYNVSRSQAKGYLK